MSKYNYIYELINIKAGGRYCWSDYIYIFLTTAQCYFQKLLYWSSSEHNQNKLKAPPPYIDWWACLCQQMIGSLMLLCVSCSIFKLWLFFLNDPDEVYMRKGVGRSIELFHCTSKTCQSLYSMQWLYWNMYAGYEWMEAEIIGWTEEYWMLDK